MTTHPTEAERGNDAGVFRSVVAIVRTSAVDTVEARLREIGVPGVSVTKVKGYGEYANFFRPDWSCRHARIEIYCRRERADAIAMAIAEAAHTGNPGDGLVVVSPVESIMWIRTRRPAAADELGGRRAPSSDAE